MARKRRRNARSVYLACVAILGAHCLLYWALTSKRPARTVQGPDRASAFHFGDQTAVRPAAMRSLLRAVYPYSVIRGGAYSGGELDAALRTDRVAAAHYAVFDRTRLRIAGASDSAAVYISYRQADRVYWTRHKVRLTAGEPLITDGIHDARARCGNRISLTPQGPVQAVEPSAIDMDRTEPQSFAPRDPAATPASMLSPPLVVHEIFPAAIPAGRTEGTPGAGGGSPMYLAGASYGGGASAPGLPEGTAVLPEFTLSLPAPGISPIVSGRLPVAPPGPGFVSVTPLPLPGGYVTGGFPGLPGPGSGPGWLVVGAPPSGTYGRPGVPGLSGIPGMPGFPPRPPTSSGAVLLPGSLGGPPTRIELPPDSRRGFDAETPEPATGALLLVGAVLVACARPGRRRLR